MNKLRKFILALLATVTLAGPVSEVTGSMNVNKVYASEAKKAKPLKLTKKQKRIAEEIKAKGTITKKGNTTTFTISDDALEQVLVKNGLIKSSKQSKHVRHSHTGKTTVKWYDNVWNGNFNIYLTKRILNRFRKMSIMSQMLNQFKGKFKSGRKFKIRHWQYKGWSYQ